MITNDYLGGTKKHLLKPTLVIPRNSLLNISNDISCILSVCAQEISRATRNAIYKRRANPWIYRRATD